MTGTEERLVAPWEEPQDSLVLEAALLHTPLVGCDRYQLAQALRWSLERLDQAAEQLSGELAGRALMLVSLRGELYLAPRTGLLDRTALDWLGARGHARTALSSAEAARLVELIAERLTSPQPTYASIAVTDSDRGLLSRGLVKIKEARDGERPGVQVHADVYYALGLAACPYDEDVPPRPTSPAPAQPAEPRPAPGAATDPTAQQP